MKNKFGSIRRFLFVGILFVNTYVVSNAIMVNAKTDDVQNVIRAYRKNSSEYGAITINANQRRAQYLINKEYYEEAKKQEDAYDEITLQDSVRDNLVKNTQDRWLNMQLDSFYDMQYSSMISKEKKEKENSIALQYYSLTVLDISMNYYKALEKQCTYELKLAKAKKKLGVGNEESISIAKENLAAVKYEKKKIVWQKSSIHSVICNEAGNVKYKNATYIPYGLKFQTEKKYVTNALKNSQNTQYTWQIETYKQYETNLKEKYSKADAIIPYYDSQIEMLESNYKIQQTKTKMSIKSQLVEVRNIKEAVKQTKNKLTTLNKKMTKVKKAYSEGLAKKSSIYELQSQKEKLKMELINNRFELLKIYYQLENN